MFNQQGKVDLPMRYSSGVRYSRAKPVGSIRVLQPSTRAVASHAETLKDARKSAAYWTSSVSSPMEIQERFPSGEWVTVQVVQPKSAKRSHATKKAPEHRGYVKAGKDLEKALADRLGFIPTEDFILRALDEWEGFTLDSLRSEERRMTREFDKRGGRGPDLADRIDAARTALALVESGFLLKGELGILKRADRYRPRLKSDFDY